MGGTGTVNEAQSLAIDTDGSVYVAGVTNSFDFPVRNAYQDRMGGIRNAFLSKLLPDGSGIDWATYLGGSGTESNAMVALDSAGNLLVAGTTDSPNFPLAGEWNGAEDGFFARFDRTGHLLESAYIGTSGPDRIAALAVNADRSAYVAGSTEPGTVDARRADILLAKVAAAAATKPTPKDLPAYSIVVPASVTVGVGASVDFPVSVTTADTDSSLFVQLTSSDPSVTINGSSIPVYIIIPQDATVPSFNPKLNGAAFGPPATITASAQKPYTNGVSAVQSTDTLLFNPASTILVGPPTTQSLFLTLTSPGGPVSAPTDIIVTLSSSNTTVATVPATVKISAGSNNANVVVTGIATGTSVIHASAPPYIVDAFATVTVNPFLTIATTSLNNGEVGLAYSETPVASGGRPPYTWKIVTGSLPAGLFFNATTGTISGTPITVTPALGVTLQVTDSSVPPVNVPASFTLTILPPGALVITKPSLLTGETGYAYIDTLTAAGGTPPYSWAVAAATPLPAGLSLNKTTGAITGTPTVPAANTPLTFTVTDSASPATTASASLVLTVVVPVPTTITPTGTPQTTVVGTAFTTPLQATVRDGNGNTMANVAVTFTAPPTPASGTFANGLTTATINTNASGIAVAPFTASTTVGSYTVTATVPGLPAASFALTNVQGLPATITITSGSGQIAPIGITYLAPLVVTVKDQYSNLVTGATVTFTAPSLGASVTFPGGGISAQVLTDSTGVAKSPAFTANQITGTFNINATVPPIATPASFSEMNVLGILLPANVSVPPGSSEPYNVTLGTPPAAGTGGTYVFLTSSAPSTVSITSSIFFKEGSTAPLAPPQITGGVTGPVTITATAAGLPPVTQTVTSAYTMSFTPNSATVVTPTTTGNLFLTLSGPAPSGGLTVNVSSDNTNVVTVPATVKFSAGTITNIPFTCAGSSGTTTIHASLLPSIADTTATVSCVGGLSITTTSLPNGSAGVAYSQSLTGSGGTAPLKWSLKTGSTLPANLTVNSAGQITGTPTTAVNNAQVTFQLTDSSSTPLTGFATLGLTITPTITPPVLTITQNQAFSTTLAATGGTGQLTWSITSGALPTGVMLTATTGVISGTTSQQPVSNSPLTIQVKDAGSQTTATLNTTFSVISAGPVQNMTASLATGVIGSTYSQTLTAQSGTPPYTWSITPLPLPGNLSLNSSTGVISSTNVVGPPSSGTFAVTVTDSTSPTPGTSTKNLTLAIAAAPLVITPVTLPAAQLTLNYSSFNPPQLQATGGIPGYSWTVTGGSLPAGIVLSTAGVFSGIPTGPVNTTSNFTVTVTDSQSKTQTANLSIQVIPLTLTITSTSLPSGQVGTAYTQTTLTNQGGTGPFTWSVTPALPIGMSLTASTGVISGTPTAPTTGGVAQSFSFTVTDATSKTATKSLSLTITTGPPATITATGGGQSAAINNAFTTPLSATVKDVGGNPLSGVVVTFAAPPSSGASGTFAGGVTTATTNASGTTPGLTFTANGTAGSYNVTATTATGTATTNIALTNTQGIILTAGQLVVAPNGTVPFPVSIGSKATSQLFVTLSVTDPTIVSINTSGFFIQAGRDSAGFHSADHRFEERNHHHHRKRAGLRHS